MKVRLIISACVLLTHMVTAQKSTVQQIPGKLECELYNGGGEGVAYHDVDSVNNGSGKLNPANGTYLNEFRMREAVDISFTKSNGIDDNPYNKRQPLMGQLYVGWTQPGEWINYSVNVKAKGNYTMEIIYTANGNGAIAFELDGKKIGDNVEIPSTADARDTVAWRHWHHWNSLAVPVKFLLEKGSHTLTLRVLEHGNMNFDFIYFKKED